MTADRLAVAAPVPDEIAAHLATLEPRLDLRYESELLPPMRHPADFKGDPSFARLRRRGARSRSWSTTPTRYTASRTRPGGPRVAPCQPTRGCAGCTPWRRAEAQVARPGSRPTSCPGRLHHLRGRPRRAAGRVRGVRAPRGGEVARAAAAPAAPARVAGPLADGPARGAADPRPRPRRNRRRVAALLAALGAEVIGTCAGTGRRAGVTRGGAPRPPRRQVTGSVDAIVVTRPPGTDATVGMLGEQACSEAAAARADRGERRARHRRRRGRTPARAGERTGRLRGAGRRRRRAARPRRSPLWELPEARDQPAHRRSHARRGRRIAELFADNATRLLDGVLRNLVDPGVLLMSTPRSTSPGASPWSPVPAGASASPGPALADAGATVVLNGVDPRAAEGRRGGAPARLPAEDRVHSVRLRRHRRDRGRPAASPRSRTTSARWTSW